MEEADVQPLQQRLEPRGVSVADQRAKFKSTLELVADPTPRNLGELAWRISLPVSALLMAVLAIPLSAMNPRVGRSVNLLAALLLYVVYNNLLSLLQTWIAQERTQADAQLLPGTRRSALDGQVVWGRLPGDVGYLAVTAMAGAGGGEAEQRAAAGRAIDAALADLKDTRALVERHLAGE